MNVFSSLVARSLLVLTEILPDRTVRALAEGLAPLVYHVPAARRGLELNARHILGEKATPDEPVQW